MTYRVLQDHLHATANSAIKYFKKEYGLSDSSIKIETEIDPAVSYIPTFHATLKDKHLICVEISEEPCPPELKGFILSCKNHGMPVKLWVVIPSGQNSSLANDDIKFSRENGIGIVEVDSHGHGNVLSSSVLSQSLTGVRPIKVSDFPAKYREPLKTAYETFCNGNPPKGCSCIYDEIESLTRRILRKCISKNYLKKCFGGNPDTDSWNTILAFLRSNLDTASTNCPQLKSTLWDRLMGMTEYRNDSGHKPASTEKLMLRDKQLRTRFESAADELKNLIEASTPLRV